MPDTALADELAAVIKKARPDVRFAQVTLDRLDNESPYEVLVVIQGPFGDPPPPPIEVRSAKRKRKWPPPSCRSGRLRPPGVDEPTNNVFDLWPGSVA